MQSGIFTNPMSGSVDTLAGGGNTGIGGPPGTPHVDGFAFASRPDSLISWFKYNAAGLDSFRLQVQLTKWIPGMGSRELIAFSEIKESSAADWKRLALNIQYFSNENPDTASIRFQSSVSDPQNPVLGSSLFVDDLSFVYNPLSVKNFSKSKFQFEVSPNPVSDFLKIQSEGTLRIQIIDSKGNLVLTAIKEAEALIDVSALPAGLYCIRLNDPAVGQFQMARFLKQ
jgi:hypothetical protein